jgi:hypothetical protein
MDTAAVYQDTLSAVYVVRIVLALMCNRSTIRSTVNGI